MAIGGNPAVREVFMAHHADLLDAAFWQHHQARIRAGHVHDVFPYDPHKRFAYTAGQSKLPHVDGAALIAASHHDLPVQ